MRGVGVKKSGYYEGDDIKGILLSRICLYSIKIKSEELINST